MEDRQISNLQKMIGELTQKSEAAQLAKSKDERIRILVEITSTMFDKSSAYANVIIIAGYAGIFTTWSLTKEHLSTKGNATVALLLVSSLLVFCTWEVFKMIYHAQKNKELAILIQQNSYTEELFRKASEIEERDKRRAIKLIYPWYVVLVVTIPTGSGAGGILMWNFLASVVGWSTWP